MNWIRRVIRRWLEIRDYEIAIDAISARLTEVQTHLIENDPAFEKKWMSEDAEDVIGRAIWQCMGPCEDKDRSA